MLLNKQRKSPTLLSIFRQNWLINFILIISYGIALYCVLRSFDVDVIFKYVALIPVFFSLFASLFLRSMKFNTPGLITFLFVSFFRYVLTPFVILANEEFCKIAKNYSYVNDAILIMIIEMLFMILAIWLYRPKITVVKNDIKISDRKLIRYLIIVGIIFIWLDNSQLVGSLSIMEGTALGNAADEFSNTSGLITIAWQSFCVFLYVYFVWQIKKMNSNFILGPILISILYILLIYTGQARISRWYTLVTACAIVTFLVKLFPSKKKKIFFSIFLPASILIVIASIIKNTYIGIGGDSIATLNALFSSTNMDIYFAGPVSVNTAIGVYNETEVNISSMLYDLLKNFPGLARISDRTLSSTYIYSAYVYRSDLILPLVGQSFIWFTYALTPFLSLLSVIIFKKMDAYYQKSNSIYAYLYAFTAIWTALMPILNLTIWVSWLYCRIIPGFLLFKFATKKIKN